MTLTYEITNFLYTSAYFGKMNQNKECKLNLCLVRFDQLEAVWQIHSVTKKQGIIAYNTLNSISCSIKFCKNHAETTNAPLNNMCIGIIEFDQCFNQPIIILSCPLKVVFCLTLLKQKKAKQTISSQVRQRRRMPSKLLYERN